MLLQLLLPLHLFLILPLPVSGLLRRCRLLKLLGRRLLLLPLPGCRCRRLLLLLWLLLRLLLQQVGWEASIVLQQLLKQLRQLAV